MDSDGAVWEEGRRRGRRGGDGEESVVESVVLRFRFYVRGDEERE